MKTTLLKFLNPNNYSWGVKTNAPLKYMGQLSFEKLERERKDYSKTWNKYLIQVQLCSKRGLYSISLFGPFALRSREQWPYLGTVLVSTAEAADIMTSLYKRGLLKG